MRNVFAALALAASLAVAQCEWDTLSPLPSPRYSAAGVTVGYKSYLLGGSVRGGVKTRTMFVYHHFGDSWTTGDSMLVARHRFGACASDDRIYLFGGWGNAGVLLNQAESYSTLTHTWTPIETLGTKRASLSGAYANGKVYAIGGWNGTTALATVEEYDPGTGHWQTRSPMPTPRSEAMVAVCNNYVTDLIYCIGGTSDHTNILDIVEVYNPAQDSWFTRPPIPTPRAAAGCAAGGRMICVFGGIGPGGTNTHATELYYTATDTWVSFTPIPSSRRYLTSFDFFHGVCAVGGLDSTMQPMTLVERMYLPMGIAEGPGSTLIHSPPATIARPGTLVRSPYGQTDRYLLDVYQPTGRCVTSFSGITTWQCPELSSGIYLLRWRSRHERPAITRLTVLDN